MIYDEYKSTVATILFYMVSASKVSLDNPFASASASMAPTSRHSFSSSDGEPADPAPTAVLQAVSIRSHVPVTLDMEEGNYGQWCSFFESTLAKFGLEHHVHLVTPFDEQDSDWRIVDACVVNWLLTTLSKGVFDIVHRERTNAFTLWHAIEGIFRDNEMQRAVYLEAEFRTAQQGDLSITDFCNKLKRLADQLRDIGHPVSEPVRC